MRSNPESPLPSLPSHIIRLRSQFHPMDIMPEPSPFPALNTAPTVPPQPPLKHQKKKKKKKRGKKKQTLAALVDPSNYSFASGDLRFELPSMDGGAPSAVAPKEGVCDGASSAPTEGGAGGASTAVAHTKGGVGAPAVASQQSGGGGAPKDGAGGGPPAVVASKEVGGGGAPAVAASKEGGGLAGETNALWVGNLPPETGDADVMAVFSGHGALDCITNRAGSRSYAFVLFRGAAEARTALDALQGARVNGASIRNEFARPARAIRNLWVGGISPSVSKEELEEEFLKFGNVECFAFFRDRNSAHVDFYKLEDAISAHRKLNRKVLGGEELCVDFQRTKHGRAELFDAISFGTRGAGPVGSLAPFGDMGGLHGSKKSFQINEGRLRFAMTAYGEVEKMKCFPSRHYAFVEFATIDEACNAKKNLEGRLFNDPRIQILFSNSDIVPQRGDNAHPFLGVPRSEMFYSEDPYGRPDYFVPGEVMITDNVNRPLPPIGVPGANALSRPYGSQRFGPWQGRSGYFDYGCMPSATGILPSPDPHLPFPAARGAWDALDTRVPKRMKVDAWDALDTTVPKRMKVDTYPLDVDPHDLGRAGSEGLGRPAGFPYLDRGIPAKRSPSPVFRGQGSIRGTPDSDYYWRGIIAKGGAHVCHARCVTIGKGIEVPLPDVVNCSARTGLDMLMKHYADARGFDIFFFLPDSEEDFASYTEFLRYLSSKNRAGVVKVDAKTTLFLVPPSDFLTEVLHVNGPERLYGVILHIPQISASAERPQLAATEQPYYYDEQEAVSTSDKNYNVIAHNDDHDLIANYRRYLPENTLHDFGHQIPARARVDETRAAQSAPMGLPTNPTAAPPVAAQQVDVSLRPDIISALAKLVPGSLQSSAPGTGQIPLGSMDRPAAWGMRDASVPSQGWRQEEQATASISSFGNLHSGQQLSSQASSTYFSIYGNMLGGQEHKAQPITNCTEIQKPTLNLPPPPPIRPPSSAVLAPQGEQYLPSQNQYYADQYVSQNNYDLVHRATASSINLPVQPPSDVDPRPLSASNLIGNLAQTQNAVPLPTDRLNMESSSHGQQLQAAVPAPAQVTLDGDADKNKRYQTTLQFAANLLLRLQREQQEAAQSARGSGNQP